MRKDGRMTKKTAVYVIFVVALSFCDFLSADMGSGSLTGHSIRVDGSVADWVGSAPAKPNSSIISKGEFIWKDIQGDDTGNGKYTYPKTPAFTKAADLEEFRITWDSRNMYFLIRSSKPGDWWSPVRVIAIDTDGMGGGRRGMQVIQQGDINTMDADTGTFGELRVSKSLSADYVICIAGTYKGRIWDAKGRLIAKAIGEKTDTAGFKIKDSNAVALEVQVPLKITGNPAGKTWRFVVAMGTEDKEHLREIYKEADDWHGGGGEATTSDDGVDPDYFDLASPDQNTQEIELSSYKPNAPAGDTAAFAEIKKSFLQVKFSPYLQVAK